MLALIDNIPLFRIRLYLYLHELYIGDLSVVFNILKQLEPDTPSVSQLMRVVQLICEQNFLFSFNTVFMFCKLVCARESRISGEQDN